MCAGMTLATRALALLGLIAGPGFLTAAPAAEATLHFGVIAEEPNEPDRMFRVYSPLLELLRRRLEPAGIVLGELVIARDLDDLAQRVTRGEVDFLLESVFPTLSLRERSKSLTPGLVVVRRGERQYYSVFFTRKQSTIQKLADLRGRTLVLQAIRSTSAFALPRAELARAGLRLVPADDAAAADPEAVRYVLALAEVNQAIWVLHGKGDAGAFSDGDWQALPERVRERLRIFATSRPILRGLVSFRSGLDPEVRNTLRQVLLGLAEDDAGREAMAQASGVTRFERLTPSELQAVDDWMPVLLRSRPR
jgi:phosphonate transport system substrate-binding protein